MRIGPLILPQMTKKQFLLILVLFALVPLYGQPLAGLSLDDAYKIMEERYPALKDGNLLNEIYQNESAQLDKSRLPSLALKADGRLQSESTSLGAEAGSQLPIQIELPLYSARSYLELSYNVLDGGQTAARQKLTDAQLQIDQQKLEVDRYALRERIDVIFINVMLLREQIKLFDYSFQDLDVRRERLAAALDAGTVLESALTQIDIKLLELRSQKENLDFRLKGLLTTLEDILDIELADDAELQFPVFTSPTQVPSIDRPEREIFSLQKEAIWANSDLIQSAKKPRLSAFAQGGVGYPNPLNLFDTNVSPYGLIGFQFSWRLTDWGKSKLQKEVLGLQARRINHAEETFLFNLDSREAAYLAEVERLQGQLIRDQEIAILQARVLEQMAAQLDEGVITSSEYILQVNAELRSRQNRAIHEAELIKTQLEFRTERGGL